MEPGDGRYNQFKSNHENNCGNTGKHSFDERRHAINGALQSCLRLVVEKAGSK
jgi:hypothetical protein